MHKSISSDKKQEIIKSTWEYLMKNGLTKASVGDLCKEYKISQSSLYYWFNDKEDIWVNAGKYGTSKVVEALLAYTFDHIDKVEEYFDTILKEVEKYKYDLRLAVQITTSPVFGRYMRDQAMEFRGWYEQYADKFVEVFQCKHIQAEIFIYSIISYIIDYAIWDDKIKTQMLLDNLKDRVLRLLKENQQT